MLSLPLRVTQIYLHRDGYVWYARYAQKALKYPICGDFARLEYNWSYSGWRPFESSRFIRVIWKVYRFGYTSVLWKKDFLDEGVAPWLSGQANHPGSFIRRFGRSTMYGKGGIAVLLLSSDSNSPPDLFKVLNYMWRPHRERLSADSWGFFEKSWNLSIPLREPQIYLHRRIHEMDDDTQKF